MCDGRNGNTYFDCIEENTFSASDILVSKKDYKFKPVYKENKLVELYNAASNQSIKIRSFYSNYVNALLHSLEVDSGVISTNLSTMDLYLNNSYSYFIILTDSKLMTASARPDSVPRLFAKVDAGTGYNVMFIKVSWKNF